MVQKRLLIGIVLSAAAAGLITCAKHCRHVMTASGGVRESRASAGCQPAQCMTHRGDQSQQEAAALAA